MTPAKRKLHQQQILTALTNPLRIISILRIALLWLRAYFGAQAKVKTADARVIETELDDRIAPEEQAIYAYLFACLYVMYVAWHLVSRLSPAKYRRAFSAYDALIREAEAVFLSNPTRMKDRLRTTHPLTLFAHTIDGPTNCFPSLHVALVVLSYQIIRDGPVPEPVLLAGMRQSCIDICRSTMKIKQHSVIDVVGGLALAEKICRVHFDPQCEDLLAEILPELKLGELAATREAIAASENLPELMTRLLSHFDHS